MYWEKITAMQSLSLTMQSVFDGLSQKAAIEKRVSIGCQDFLQSPQTLMYQGFQGIWIKVCKTFIPRFKSGRHLQKRNNLNIQVVSLFFVFIAILCLKKFEILFSQHVYKLLNSYEHLSDFTLFYPILSSQRVSNGCQTFVHY